MGRQAKQLRDRLRRIAAALPERAGLVLKDLAIAGSEALVDGSMVDTGRLRQGWDAGIGAPSTFVPPDGKESYPDDAKERCARQIQRAPTLETIAITNNLPHASVWETGSFEPPDPGPSKGRGRRGTRRRRATEGIVLVEGGYHTAAPQGFLAQGIARIEKQVRLWESRGLGLREAAR